MTLVAALSMLVQDPDLAARSRQVFAPLMDFVLEKDRLVIKSTVPKEKLSEALDELSEKLTVGHGACVSGSGSMSWSSSDGDGRADITFEPSERSGVFSWAYQAPGDGESLELRQTEPGVMRLVHQTEETVCVFRQRKDGRCTLVVIDGLKAGRWEADSFNALLEKEPEAVVTHVLAHLERYFDDAPLSRFSGPVIELALNVVPVTADEARELEDLVEKLKLDSIEARAAAEVELRTRAAKSAPLVFAINRLMEKTSDAEVRARLGAVLGSVPHRKEVCAMVARESLYRDLAYLAKLLAAGRPAQVRLEALTGKSFPTPAEWASWVKQKGSTLKWDEEKWKYRE